MDLPAISQIAINWITGKHPPTTAERIVQVVSTVAKVILCGLGVSAVAYGSGVLMMNAGICMQTSPTFAALPFRLCGTTLLNTGTAIAAFGRALFLTITVPLYGVFYELPKFILSNGLPYLRTTAIWISEIAIKAIDLATQCLQGMSTMAQRVLIAMHRLLSPIFDTLISAVQAIWCFVMEQADRVITHLLEPALQFAITAITTIIDAVGPAFTWTADKVLLPLLRLVANAAMSIWAGVIGTASWMNASVIQPALNFTGTALASLTAIAQSTAAVIADAANAVFAEIASGLNVLHSSVITPTITAVTESIVAMNDLIVQGVNEASVAVTQTFSRVFG